MAQSISNSKNNNQIFSITIIGALFFVIGFITWANSQLIPYLRTACQLTDTESYFVISAFFAAYFFMAIPSSLILKWQGFKNGMVIGLFTMGIGALLFIPAAKLINYPLFLSGLFLLGTGLALLQTAVNPYVTILGPIESAARRISIMGVCNKLAGVCAIYLLGYLFLEDIDAIEKNLLTLNELEKNKVLSELAGKVINPYIVLSTILFVLGVILYFIKLPEVNDEELNHEKNIENPSTSVFQHRNLVLGAVAIFLYVGAEVITYDAFSSFGESLGFSKKESATFASFTAYALILGYFISIAVIPKYIKQGPALMISSLLSILFLVLALLTEGYIAILFFALLGLSQSAMWPSIWPLALNGLGKHTKLGGAILIMMIVGGAVMMPLMGKLVEWIQGMGVASDVEAKKLGFLIMIPCWLYLIFYATNGKKSKFLN